MLNFKCLNLNPEINRIIIFAACSWMVFLVFVHNFNFSKFSYYYSSYSSYLTYSKELELSAFKAKNEIQSWIKQNSIKTKIFDNNQTNYICVSIISKNRLEPKTNYVNQAIMSVLTRTPFKNEYKVRFVAFNVEENPENNKNLLQLENIVKVVNVSSKINSNSTNKRIKEALDYIECLKYLKSLRCSYSIILEDDSILVSNWLSRIEDGLQKLNNTNQDWLLIKLFSGYAFFDKDWANNSNVCLYVMFSTFLTVFLEYYLFKLYFIRKNKVTYCAIVLLFFNSIGLNIVYNSTSINPIVNGVHEHRTGFGTVSLLIPFKRLEGLIDFLNSTMTNYLSGRSNFFLHKDLLIEVYRNMNGLKEFIIEPSLTQHIGLYSSLNVFNDSYNAYRNMFMSYSFVDNFKSLKFKE